MRSLYETSAPSQPWADGYHLRIMWSIHWIAEKLSKSSKTSPKFGGCLEGKVHLPPLEAAPEPLQTSWLWKTNLPWLEIIAQLPPFRLSTFLVYDAIYYSESLLTIQSHNKIYITHKIFIKGRIFFECSIIPQWHLLHLQDLLMHPLLILNWNPLRWPTPYGGKELSSCLPLLNRPWRSLCQGWVHHLNRCWGREPMNRMTNKRVGTLSPRRKLLPHHRLDHWRLCLEM